MKEALKEFVFNATEHCGLRLFEMPTGSGKTYGTVHFIYDFLKNPQRYKDVPRVFYMTPLKNNLASVMSDLEKLCEEKGDYPLFEDNVLKITANVDSVIENIKDVEAEDEITKMSSFKRLKDAVDALTTIEEVAKDHAGQFREQIQVVLEPQFRRELEKKIAIWKAKKGQERILTTIKRDYKWLLKVYPAILTSQRRVIFTTVDKFYVGNHPIIEKSYRFISHTITKNALIIIDECDKAKMSILSEQIRNSTDFKLDLLQLTKTIYHSFKNEKMPNNLFIQANPDEKEKTTRRAFEKTRSVFEETFENHNLNYHFKLDDEEDAKSFFIFHDYTPMMVLGSDKQGGVFIRRDDRKRLNIITREENGKTDTLGSLIGALTGAINFFIQFVSMAADNYMAAKNKGKEASDKIELEDAVSTVIDVFGISEKSLDTLKRVVINSHKIKTKTDAKNIVAYDLYEDGYQMYTFTDDNSHDLETKIMMAFLDDTPEKFMKTLASKAMVSCLSATATCDTVINNLNLSYLREQLGDLLSVPPKDTVNRMKQFYKERMSENPFATNVITVESSEDIVGDCFVTEDGKSAALSEISAYNPKPYDAKRFMKLVKSIKHFILCDDAKVLLSMTNKLVKENESKDIYNAVILNRIIDIICKENSITDDKKPLLLSFNSKTLQAKKREYNQAIKQGKKVILCTSYNTAGTGQNLYHTITVEDEEIKVDIDSEYLEKPTYILTQPSGMLTDETLARIIYENLALASKGETSFKNAKYNIRLACRALDNDEEDEQKFNSNYDCRSVNNGIITVLKQAIGRISRTDNKGGHIKSKRIYVDNEIFESVYFGGEKDKFNTNEFAEVLNASTKKTISTDDQVRLTAALNNSDITRERIYHLLSEDRTKWSEPNMEEWMEIREFVLKHPTISRKELLDNPKMMCLYLRSSVSGKINSYYYKREGEKVDKIYYEKAPNERKLFVVSNDSLHLEELMSVGMVKRYFIERGYALSLEPNDYILLPNIVDDIYRGALGEAVGKAIFDEKIARLVEISDVDKFEKFDYQLLQNRDVYIDFKNWAGNRMFDESKELEKIRKKMASVNAKAVFIVNIMSKESARSSGYDDSGPKEIQRHGNIYIVPWLLRKNLLVKICHIRPVMLSTIKSYVEEYVK